MRTTVEASKILIVWASWRGSVDHTETPFDVDRVVAEIIDFEPTAEQLGFISRFVLNPHRQLGDYLTVEGLGTDSEVRDVAVLIKI